MKIATKEIRELVATILDHVEQSGFHEVAIDHDYYWEIRDEDLYDRADEPTEFTMGQLSYDWERLKGIHEGSSPPVGYALSWLGSILHAIAPKLAC